MESFDLFDVLGLSSYSSDLRINETGKFESRQRMELFECYRKEKEVFCIFYQYLGIYDKFEIPRTQAR